MTATKTKYALTQDVTQGELLSAYVVAPFDKGLGVLQQNDYELISLEEYARVRMQEGAQATVSQNGNWVNEDALYIPGKGAFITKFPIIANNAKEAIQDHARGKDFYLTSDQVEQSLVDAVALNGKAIPTNKFGENELIAYIFGEHADDYGKFLKEYGISKMPVWLADTGAKPFARKLWFGTLGPWRLAVNDRSVLFCDRILYNDYYRVRGVRKNSAEGATQKISLAEMKVEANVESKVEVYTPDQISKALEQLKISGLESLLFDQLRKR